MGSTCKTVAKHLFVLGVICSLAMQGGVAYAQAITEPLIGPNTRSVVVGALDFEDPSLITYPTEFRKDQELDAMLNRIGVPDSNRQLLLDGAATIEGMKQALLKASETANPDDTLFFYYAGHGSISTGEMVMVSYDANSEGGEPGLSVSMLEKIIAENWKGGRVVLMGDFCYSGQLGDVAQALRAKGIEALSLTSASKSNQSTGSWSFTQSILDGFAGRPLLDIDRDGVITLSELDQEVRVVMRNRESQMSGFSATTDQLGLTIARAANDNVQSGAQSGKWQVGQWLCTARGPARAIATSPDSVTANIYDYNQYEEVTYSNGNVIPFKLHDWPVGENVMVLYDKKEYEANILQRVDGFHEITYPGYARKWDEWITSERIVRCMDYRGSRDIEVEWGGQWYPAQGLCQTGEQTLIRYDGYDSCWDEWVGPDRIRTARQ